MKRLIAKHGHCSIAERDFEPFHMLANSIISQQLSTRAAATIKQRVGVLVGMPFQIGKVLSTAPAQLRGAGLSGAKTRYIGELAAHVSDGRLDFEEILSLNDEAVIEKLGNSSRHRPLDRGDVSAVWLEAIRRARYR